jgi:hypothetical protein
MKISKEIPETFNDLKSSMLDGVAIVCVGVLLYD